MSGTPTAAEVQGGNALRAEMMARLEGGNALPMPERRSFAFDPKLKKPGMLEKIGNIAGPGLSMFSMLDQLRQQQAAQQAKTGTGNRPADATAALSNPNVYRNLFGV